MKSKAKTTPGEMTDIDVNFLSLVRKGANRQKVQIYKEDEDTPPTEQETMASGLLTVLRNFFKSGDSVEKADEAAAKTKKPTSFAASIAISDVMDSMWRLNDTLRDVFRNIITDEDVTDKKAAMAQAVDEYAEYLKGKINGSKIAKEDMEGFLEDTPLPVQKEGRKLSTKNMSTIKSAIATLNAILGETDPGDNGEKGADESVNKEELAKIMKGALDEALEPINARISKLENPDGPAAQGQEQPIAEETTSADVTEVIKSAVSEAIAPLNDRLAAVEKSRGLARSDEGAEGADIKKQEDAVFDGYFA